MGEIEEEKPVAERKIKLVRLLSGEELICAVSNPEEEDSPKGVLPVHFPFLILPAQKKGTMDMMRWMPYVRDEKIELNINLICFVVTPQSSIEDHYINIIENLNSQIIKPDSKIISA